mmetsp:Transcript_16019/g.44095  ORF Transcript_16019/g.44095 Transcript_16019/m.44095 type:complete len:95 (+) Transcript_16019:630-914(+)
MRYESTQEFHSISLHHFSTLPPMAWNKGDTSPLCPLGLNGSTIPRSNVAALKPSKSLPSILDCHANGGVVRYGTRFNQLQEVYLTKSGQIPCRL